MDRCTIKPLPPTRFFLNKPLHTTTPSSFPHFFKYYSIPSQTHTIPFIEKKMSVQTTTNTTFLPSTLTLTNSHTKSPTNSLKLRNSTNGFGKKLSLVHYASSKSKAGSGVPSSNYVVPFDSSSCITRPLAEILRDLNKRIADNIIVKQPADTTRSALIPW